MNMVNTEVLMFAGLAMTALKLLRAEQRTATNKKVQPARFISG